MKKDLAEYIKELCDKHSEKEEKYIEYVYADLLKSEFWKKTVVIMEDDIKTLIKEKRSRQ